MELWQYILLPLAPIVAVLLVALLIGWKALSSTSGSERPEILRALADLLRAVRGKR
ncbi:hypothetical protein GCM10020229_13200 [Kitasatospora albolonga]